MHVLCHRTKREYCFVDSKNSQDNEVIFMTETGSLIARTTLEMDTKSYLQKLDIEGWERMK